ncbi:hypothetical protein GA0115246_104423 [Streptomyces sp. SolWspMP-sol7th]|nr:hypothetical protein GA0115246_104423 [Streptomyces sp. SolWspMP-sol7th]
MSPWNVAPSAEPVSTSRSGEPDVRPLAASSSTIALATVPPSSAHTMSPPAEPTPPHVRPSTTAKAAPELTPRRPVSASGLRVAAWSRHPETPRQHPTTSAARVRGSRTSCTASRTCASARAAGSPVR